MNFLTTGTKSGFGRYVFEKLGGASYTRETSALEYEAMKKKAFGVIIHAAFNSAFHVEQENVAGYLEDNIFLTGKMLDIPHDKFVFMSTVDIYPKDSRAHNENEEIAIESIGHLYGIAKRISEEIILKRAKNPLVLRLSSLAGAYSRKNTLMKIIRDERPELGLSAQSRLNFVRYKDVFDFIQYALAQNLNGVYNIASSDSIDLQSIADLTAKSVKFGSVPYNPGSINTQKVNQVFPRFKKSSLEVLKDFLSEEIFSPEAKR